MVFWIVVAVVVVLGFALSWVVSGRQRPTARRDFTDPHQEQAKAHVQRNQIGGAESGPPRF
ncbi:hypothetical protein GCM10011519_34560 [Marmoricola endophyticus]|uniref:Uncharacterized protein n=1 Tax=Marmoricola endophyticus TaxID=2040280 RepID=A0A917BUX6_9ACTN|nr:hypothetical protein [Marmoricola endophyticus]GGF57738.1 hypothetical protein GCM10011519_34560 [Marmoricola endophyticus]